MVEPALPAGRTGAADPAGPAEADHGRDLLHRSLIFLPAWSLLVGGIAYGFGPYIGPTGEQIGWPSFAGRLVIIVVYLLLSQLVVAALAFAFGVWTDAPLGAVGGAVVIMIVMAILDTISALGDLRQGLPGHYAYAWADALSAADRLLRHDQRRALVGRLCGGADLGRLLALPAQGHHQLT